MSTADLAGPDLATPDLAGPDLAALRRDRRDRLFRAMADHDLDVLVLGRPEEVAFATGAHQLWTSGTRPFGPAGVVVRETGRTHLLSVSDHGIPPEISHGELYGLSWNPANLAASLAAIPGLPAARRIGTTSSTPGFGRFLAAVAPHAEVVDGATAFGAARAVKSAHELACIVRATAIAEAALTAMIDALRPGVSERDLVAAHVERLGSLGVPTPPTEGVACALPGSGPARLRHLATDRPIGAGELVALDAGAFFAGYEGGVGRTWLVGSRGPTAEQRALAERCRVARAATVDACRAGATGAEVRRAWTATGEPVPAVPIVSGVGLGAEPPVIADGIGDQAVLAAGMVLSVTAWVASEGVGGFLERDLVLVGPGAPDVLSRYGRGPVATGEPA